MIAGQELQATRSYLFRSEHHDRQNRGKCKRTHGEETGKCAVTVGLLVIVEARLVLKDNFRVAVFRLSELHLLLCWVPHIAREGGTAHVAIAAWFPIARDVVQVLIVAVVVLVARDGGVDHVFVGDRVNGTCTSREEKCTCPK